MFNVLLSFWKYFYPSNKKVLEHIREIDIFRWNVK